MGHEHRYCKVQDFGLSTAGLGVSTTAIECKIGACTSAATITEYYRVQDWGTSNAAVQCMQLFFVGEV